LSFSFFISSSSSILLRDEDGRERAGGNATKKSVPRS
jgi:hypothetical protein